MAETTTQESIKAAESTTQQTTTEKLVQIPESEFKALKDQVQQMPGMLKRLISEAIPKTEQKTEIATQQQTTKATDNKEDAWKTAIKGLEDKLAAKEIEVTVRAALGKKKWGDSDYVLSQLLPKVKSADGKLTIPGKRKIGDSEVDSDLTLDEAIEQFAAKNPWIVQTTVHGGSGAVGATATLNAANKPTYEQLMSDPKMLNDWQTADPETTAKILNEGIAKQKRK